MASTSYRVEAERWLSIAEKLLATRDLHGAKTFAIRARESDPRLFEFADQIFAVVDTLLASDLRINNNLPDYYEILQLGRLTHSMEAIATQYRKLALLLNPTRNTLPYADQAFKLVSEAWMVFSNPSEKAMYDRELELSHFVLLGQLGHQQQHHQFQNVEPQLQTQTSLRSNSRHPQGSTVNEDRNTTLHLASEFNWQPAAPPPPPKPVQPTPVHPTRLGFQPVGAEQTRLVNQQINNNNTNEWTTLTNSDLHRRQRKENQPSTSTTNATPLVDPPVMPATTSTAFAAAEPEPQVPSFWTTCPYCYILYEYPKEYEGCALICQNCKRAFHAVVIPSPPLNGKDGHFCCWGFYPLGYSGRKKISFGAVGNWAPFSAMFAPSSRGRGNAAARAKPKVIYDDDVYIEISDPSEEESDSDDDWRHNKKKPKTVPKSGRGRGRPRKYPKTTQNDMPKKGNIQNADGGTGSNMVGEVEGKGQGTSGKKKGTKDLGKLDLNVMFSNEADDAAPRASGRSGAQNGAEEDNIEGNAFFEGLEEFLNTLPILSVVGDDKGKTN